VSRLQAERDLRAALEVGLSMSSGWFSSSRGMDSQTKAELEEIALAEADVARLKQKVAELHHQLNQQRQHHYKELNKSPGERENIKSSQKISHFVHRHEPPVMACEVPILQKELDVLTVCKPASVPVRAMLGNKKFEKNVDLESLHNSKNVVAAIYSSHIIVSNCGDSRAVLCHGKEPMALSVDHKPNRDDDMQELRLFCCGSLSVSLANYRRISFCELKFSVLYLHQRGRNETNMNNQSL
ncbi:hypothetical protein S83_008730, partial [Arachis hypogaea]